MRNYKFYTTSFLILSVLFLSLSSCKKCKLEGENVDSGVIVTDVSVYPEYGYITQDTGPDHFIHGNSSVADKFEMSTDDGFTKSPFNYSAYTILAYPLTLNCNHFLKRDVVIDDVNMNATYVITVTQCKDTKCTEQRYVENYVVIPAIPETYTILRDVKYVDQ